MNLNELTNHRKILTMKMIKLTKDQIVFFNRPFIKRTETAKILISSGLYEDKYSKDEYKRFEYEQAVYLDWSLYLLDEHGDDWKAKGNKIIDELCDKLQQNT